MKKVYNPNSLKPPEMKCKIEDKINEMRGISTCCEMCGAAFVDAAKFTKAKNSEKLMIEFMCNKCSYLNEHISHLLIIN